MGHLILLRRPRDVAVSATPHLTAAEVAAFVDGTLSDAERERAERHLAECDECREEVASCGRLVATMPIASARRIPYAGVIPLAAAILIAVVWRRPADRSLDTARERGAASEGTRISLVAPAPDAALALAAPQFVWRSIAGSAGYRVVIKDASGALVWSSDVADTSLAVPDSVALQPGRSYLWRVDGQRTDGTTASSAETVFRVAR